MSTSWNNIIHIDSILSANFRAGRSSVPLSVTSVIIVPLAKIQMQTLRMARIDARNDGAADVMPNAEYGSGNGG